MNIATTIADQIGRGSLFMIGAKNLGGTGKGDGELGGLSFKIMRNTKKVTHVKIALMGDDTYKVTFLKQHRRPSFEVETLDTVEGVYFDMLRSVIKGGTGLDLTL